MKKRHTKFKTLFSSKNKNKVEKFFEKLKDKEGISIYHRKYDGRDKQTYHVRQVVRRGVKSNA
jgi:adenine C2-methylase RlmN of 23S rRNA A2503 and tRNA A37